MGNGSGGDERDGKRQVKLRSLARRSPPAVRPGAGVGGIGDPCCEGVGRKHHHPLLPKSGDGSWGLSSEVPAGLS